MNPTLQQQLADWLRAKHFPRKEGQGGETEKPKPPAEPQTTGQRVASEVLRRCEAARNAGV
jgi:hypothetical protein